MANAIPLLHLMMMMVLLIPAAIIVAVISVPVAAAQQPLLEVEAAAVLRSQMMSSSSSSDAAAAGSNTSLDVLDDGVVVARRLQGRTRWSGSGGGDLSRLRDAHKIKSLPGQPEAGEGEGFDQYSGYVTVDESNGRRLFYYFVEAPRHQAAATKPPPLVLWINGGPGCSSVGYGAFEEIGRYRVNEDAKTLYINKHAWNNAANVIFVESPVDVGYSCSNTSSDYDNSGDESAADDLYVFLVNWLELFPEYKGRPFYIAGESYAGHYAPQLAATILLLNKHYNSTTIINLQGVMVGNPYLDKDMNEKGRLDFYLSHGLISPEFFDNISRTCFSDGSDIGACISAALDAYDAGPIDVYNIYAPVCIDDPNGAGYYPSSRDFHGYDPCTDKYTVAYLNDPAVQSAFHARRMTNWSLCVNLTWKDAPISMVPTIKWLISEGLRVWIYSGDFDSVCPLQATRYSISELGLHVTTPWRPWIVNKEVAGFVEQFTGGFTFATVREAGHDVPSYQPERALVLFKSFLKGELPPANGIDE